MSDILEELVTKFTYDVDQAGLNKYLRSQEKINRNTKTMIGLNTTLGRVMRNIFVGAGAVMGINGLIKTYRGIDLIRRSIEGLTKSTQDWDYIQKEALRTGTDIEAVAKGYRNFYSAASMAGFDKNGIQEMYSDVLVASRAIGASQQQVSGALLALEQMLSKGKVSMEELRRQLGNALPGAFEIGAKAMGVTTQKFNEMVKAGLQANEFVPKFTKELLNTYKTAFPEAIKSLDFAMVNLTTSWKLFQYEIMKGSAGQELAKSLNMITEFLRSPAAVSIAQGIGKALQLVVKGLEFVVKHWRMILFLFGTNTLMGGIRNLYRLRASIVDLAMDIGYGKVSLGGALDNIVFALSNIITTGGGVRALIKSIGVALIPLGRSMLWLTAIAAVLYGIYVTLEDIFTYINHPEAESFTKDLVNQLPIVGELIEDIKTAFKDMKPIMAEIQQIWAEIGQDLLKTIKGSMPLMIAYWKYNIIQALIWMRILEGIVTLILKITQGLSRLFKSKNLLEAAAVLNSPYAKLAIGGGAVLGAEFNKITGVTQNSTRGYMSQLGMTDFVGSVAGGYGSFNKVQTDNKTITNTFQIYAQNRSDKDMINLINKALSGEVDNASALWGY